MTDRAVEPGQVWIDNDARCESRRTLRVESVDARYAYCLVLTDWHGAKDERRRTRISLARFRATSTGYRLAV